MTDSNNCSGIDVTWSGSEDTSDVMEWSVVIALAFVGPELPVEDHWRVFSVNVWVSNHIISPADYHGFFPFSGLEGR
jgi:hypothetical protein